jgi:hypothetical protein
MTKEQAREYATRIRLGEPLFFWMRPSVSRGPGGPIRVGWTDGTTFARRGRMLPKPDGASQWTILEATPKDPDAVYGGEVSFSRSGILAALDQIANAP